MIYTDIKTKKISFPLGGIGSGSIGLAGNGRLVDWEIFNRPNKQSFNEYTHFAIKAECDGKVLDARVLQGDIQEEFIGGYVKSHHSWGIGHGPNRTTLAGLPHFREVSFNGEFPIATIQYKEEKFPGHVTLKAFNPFIPSNEKDSSIPAAFFEWTVHNSTQKEMTYTLNFACGNPFKDQSVNTYKKTGDIHILNMGSQGYEVEDEKYGNLSIATDFEDLSFQEYWYRSGWFDDVTVYWKEFSRYGEFKNRHYEEPGMGDMCVLAPRFTLKPHESKKVRFALGWFVPNYVKYWGNLAGEDVPKWKNYYTRLFGSSEEVVRYALGNWDSLNRYTMDFKDVLFSSTLPSEVIDAIQGNIAILKSSTCLRLENGEFYGWEGTNEDQGSCEGSCTHVWNYAYALPFLFPSLERSMRELHYKYNLMDNGGLRFRLMLPLGSKQWGFRPCVDGQMGDIIKVYRDWKICGDHEWLARLWPSVKKSLEYAWSSENEDRWDPQKSGVITGRQHHTLDMELFGPNSWMTGFYLAALKAASEMATYLGEHESAEEYLAILHKGQKWVEENLFDGEHYIQKIDLKDKTILEPYEDAKLSYWNDENDEIKYQIQEGCEIDQVVAQWHASLNGLGDIFDPQNRRKAISSIYHLNFKSMRDIFNPCRIFCVNDEKGLIICEWDENKYKPLIPIPYTEETMCGFEYAAAGMMIQEGLIEEGLEVIRAVRDRYDGEKRNPWSELECGSSYARSMASYSFLLTFSGFEFDMSKKHLGFNPLQDKNIFSTFWAIDGAWGKVEISQDIIILHLLYGNLQLSSLRIPDTTSQVLKVFTGSRDIEYSYKDNVIYFNQIVELKDNARIYVNVLRK